MQAETFRRIEGGIIAPKGFRAVGIHCGIKSAKKDLALIVSDTLAVAAGMFTTNAVKAAPVLLSQERIQSGAAQAIVVNSGNANACTGTQGMADAREMAALTAGALDIAEEFVLAASTGIIGVPLPMAPIRRGIPAAAAGLERDGTSAAEAILTTDAFPKTAAVRVELDGVPVTIGGMAKGAGMIHPQMATTLCFLTTDAVLPPPLLRAALRAAIDRSFNCISVDGDTSTNDTVILLANGAARTPALTEDSEAFARFNSALADLTTSLARMIVRDGEGASKVVTLTVKGARSAGEAKAAAGAVMTSPLVKTAIYGAEPNWGRVLAAVGRSGASVREDRVSIWIGGHQVVGGGIAVGDPAPAGAAMRMREFEIVVDLGLGDGTFTGWMSDLNEAYVKINAGYMT
ncbi:MAG TPA: bifunctional glutamate N-acetyltransferase/amino-acid acetyltransferase ArgJ [bacterium]